MGCDWEAHRQQLLQHYTQLAQTEGWGQYTRERLKQLARDCPDLYADFQQLVTQALARLEPGSLPDSSGSP